MFSINDKNFDTEEEYQTEWMRIITKLKEVLGCKVLGFSPGVSIYKTGEESCSLPMWVVMAIIGEPLKDEPISDKPKYFDEWNEAIKDYNISEDDGE